MTVKAFERTQGAEYNGTEILIKDWFVEKLNIRYFFIRENSIIKETEKAFLFEVDTFDSLTNSGYIETVWVPKSCTLTREEKLAEIAVEESRIAEGAKRHDEIYEFCKAHGLKVRKNFRIVTMIEKLDEAGIEHNFKAQDGAKTSAQEKSEKEKRNEKLVEEFKAVRKAFVESKTDEEREERMEKLDEMYKKLKQARIPVPPVEKKEEEEKSEMTTYFDETKTIEIEITGHYDDVSDDITDEVLSCETIGYNRFIGANKVYSVDDCIEAAREFAKNPAEYESASFIVRELSGIDYDAIPDLPRDGAPLIGLRNYVEKLPAEVFNDAKSVLNVALKLAERGDASELVKAYLNEPSTFKKCYIGRTKISFACDVAMLLFKINELEILEDEEVD